MCISIKLMNLLNALIDLKESCTDISESSGGEWCFVIGDTYLKEELVYKGIPIEIDYDNKVVLSLRRVFKNKRIKYNVPFRSLSPNERQCPVCNDICTVSDWVSGGFCGCKNCGYDVRSEKNNSE
jgi:hypothetical protein